MADLELQKVTDYLWEIPQTGGMRVPARIYATEDMIDDIVSDEAPQQVANVAHLPGIVKASMAMPDIHWGYGFPIGGVAAFDVDEGVISPGGVGYDINCGVRLMVSDRLNRSDVEPHAESLIDELFGRVPTGVGSSGALSISKSELRRAVQGGAEWAVNKGYGRETDLEYIEENGQIDGAEPDSLTQRALERGTTQIGTLGSGNHFLEVGSVAEIFDPDAAGVLGLSADQVAVIIHTGSRGFGYQICDDYLKVMDNALERYEIELPDRQLACAPIQSDEGQRYVGAMHCAINYAFANRQVIAHNVRESFANTLRMQSDAVGLRTVYEVAHNIAKFETHDVDGGEQALCVHRKGATRAFGPGQEGIPSRYGSVGQPVLIPGDMGRYSYVLVGTDRAMTETFGSTCHGAGRRMSRRQAKKTVGGRNVAAELKERGIVVKGATQRTLNEEIPEAYKDVAEVVEACETAGISKKVAQLRPIGCIKG